MVPDYGFLPGGWAIDSCFDVLEGVPFFCMNVDGSANLFSVCS